MTRQVNMHECANCGSTLTGQYCSHCGQKSGTERLSLASVVSGAFAALTDLDSTLPRTIKELSVNPGKVAHNYVSGARVSYINPVKYCIAVFAIILALMHVTGQIDLTAERVTAANNARALEAARNGQTIPDAIQASQRATVEVYTEYLQPLQLLLIPIAALLLRLLHFRRQRNYAEVFCFLAFVFGHAALLNIPVLALMSLSGFLAYYNLWVYSGFLLIIFGYGAKVFFDLSVGWAIISGLISGVLYAVTMILLVTVASTLRLNGFI